MVIPLFCWAVKFTFRIMLESEDQIKPDSHRSCLASSTFLYIENWADPQKILSDWFQIKLVTTQFTFTFFLICFLLTANEPFWPGTLCLTLYSIVVYSASEPDRVRIRVGVLRDQDMEVQYLGGQCWKAVRVEPEAGPGVLQRKHNRFLNISLIRLLQPLR